MQVFTSQEENGIEAIQQEEDDMQVSTSQENGSDTIQQQERNVIEEVSFANITMPEWCPPPEHVPMTTTRANVTPPLELTPGNLIPEYELIREGSQGKCKNGKKMLM